jgi:hypothetical protein
MKLGATTADRHYVLIDLRRNHHGVLTCTCPWSEAYRVIGLDYRWLDQSPCAERVPGHSYPVRHFQGCWPGESGVVLLYVVKQPSSHRVVAFRTDNTEASCKGRGTRAADIED